jgi:FlaA1/EpsC-like NDP-sugar epimerase
VALVTGAGGSIGSELARQVARFSPSTLLLVDRAEPALFNIDRELRDSWPDLKIVPLMADVGDRERMQSILTAHCPAIVLHSAAHKHVPLMESNPIEAVKNNVLATHRLAEQAGHAGVEVFVLISTDKAVNPRSVMGATKRMAELVVQSLNGRYPTRFVAVRFGNVIGSAGSVIPIFQEQIQRGGPVTVTHPDMVRYFMTIPEASQLVLQAAAIGEGGEIFILDMGEPVKIVELAKDTIRLSGLRPNEDIDIVFTGLRPGEKLFEELEIHGESIVKTKHAKIFTGKIAMMPPERVDQALRQLAAAALSEADDAMRTLLDSVVPEADLSPVPEGATGDQVRTGKRVKILQPTFKRASKQPTMPGRAS